MKILAILTYYHPHWTGLTAHAQRVAEALAARGHAVTVLTIRHSRSLPRDERVNGVRVVRLLQMGRFSRGAIAPAFPFAAARLIAQSDVVQIHTPLPEALLVALLCRALNRPLVMTHHGDVVMPAGTFNQAVQRVAYTLLRATGELADAVTAYSRDYALNSPLLRPLADHLTCIDPPVEIPPPDPAAVAAWKAELGLADRRLIGFAGRWVEEKGFDFLLEAMPIVRREIPNAHLVYAGEKNVFYENFYERCLPLIEAEHDHLTFLGLIRDRRRLANFYAMCDLFALPSRTDQMGLVQVEALLCGTPLVVSDIPGARVVVQETGLGRLVPPGDPPALARAIVDMLRNPAPYQPTVEAVRRVFDTERTISQYEAVMARLVRERGGDPAPARRAPKTLSTGLRQSRAEAPREPAPPVATHGTAAGSLAAPGANGRLNGARRGSLTAQDHATLNRILRNEADMAYRRRARVLLDYLELRDGDRVLDCGCGMGFYLMAMSRLRSLRLVGLDGDPERLAWARREGVPAALVRGDIERLPFADGAFDRILLSEVLEHLRDEAAALAELYRVLRPGGILAVSVPHADYPLLWDPINRLWTAVGGRPFRQGPLVGIWTNHERLYRPEDLAGRLQAAGFAVEALEEATHYSFPLSHFLVYGVGKPLIERNLLPGELRVAADRFAGERNRGRLTNPINLGRAVFRVVDRLNDRPEAAEKRTFVNVLAKARKPDPRGGS